MAHFLDANQLAEACNALGLRNAEKALIDACDKAGDAIARKLGIGIGIGIGITSDASNQPGLGGLCVGFGQAHEEQPCPDEILDFDSSSDWHDKTVGLRGKHAARSGRKR